MEKGRVEAPVQSAPASEIIIAQVGAKGGIELPKDIMTRYGLVTGETVYCSALPDGLMILSREAALQQVTAMARERMPEQAALIETLLGANRGDAPRSP